MLLALIVASSVIVPGASIGNERPLDRLASALEVDKQHADHVILLDMSGSMRWEARPGSRRTAPVGQRRIDLILSAMPALLDAIPAEDHVAVIGFHEGLVESPSFLVNHWRGVASRTPLLEAVGARLEFGQRTDLGRALEGARQHLVRPDANRIQFVYLLTDGEHDAPDSSPYRTPDAPAWDQAARTWAGLVRSDDHVIETYLFGLFDVRNAGPVARVLPALQFLAFQTADDLRTYLVKLMGEAMHRRVAAALRKEAAAGDWSIAVDADRVRLDGDGKAAFPVQVSVSFPHMGVVGRLEVAASSAVLPDGNEVRVLPVELARTEPAEGPQTLSVPLEADTLKPDWTSFGSCQETRVPFRVSWAEAGWHPKADFESAGLAELWPLQLGSREGAVTVEQCRRGLLWVPIAAGFLVLAGLVLLAIRYRPRRIVVEVEGGSRYSGFATSVEVGSGSGCQVHVSGFPARALTITRRRYCLSSYPRMRVEDTGCRIDEEPIANGEEMNAPSTFTMTAQGKKVRINIGS